MSRRSSPPPVLPHSKPSSMDSDLSSGQLPTNRYTGQNFTVACTYTVRGSPRYLPLLLSSYERV